MRSGFAIMTMQSGFALLETGCVSSKNIANIMIKNIVDVAFGGLCYWMVGYALSYGRPSNPFCGLGDFFVNSYKESEMGTLYTRYYFQFSFASTATTIVSGSVAERMRLHAYMIYSFLNTLSYCVPTAWVWNDVGFLNTMGFYDFAGACAVHANGGASAVVAAIMLGPRNNRFSDPERYQMSSPVTALTGTLLLWWAWFAFNCGSTLGSVGASGKLWKINALVAMNTLNGSIGGSLTGFLLSMIVYRGNVHVDYVINSVLGGLVGITAVCSVTTPLESIFIGVIGAVVAILAAPAVEMLQIDDPVGAIAVHFVGGIWGTLAVGIFGQNNFENYLKGNNGLLHGGGFKLLGIQMFGMIMICLWSGLTTFIFFFIIDKTMGTRMSLEEEELGADLTEHDIIKGGGIRGMTRDDEEMDENEENNRKILASKLIHEANNQFTHLPNVTLPDFRTLAQQVLIAKALKNRRSTILMRNVKSSSTVGGAGNGFVASKRSSASSSGKSIEAQRDFSASYMNGNLHRGSGEDRSSASVIPSNWHQNSADSPQSKPTTTDGEAIYTKFRRLSRIAPTPQSLHLSLPGEVEIDETNRY